MRNRVIGPQRARRDIRRPAADPRVLKRPRRKKDEDEEEEEPSAFQKFSKVDLRKLSGFKAVALQDARYYGQAAPVAGHLKGLTGDGEALFVKAKGVWHQK